MLPVRRGGVMLSVSLLMLANYGGERGSPPPTRQLALRQKILAAQRTSSMQLQGTAH